LLIVCLDGLENISVEGLRVVWWGRHNISLPRLLQYFKITENNLI